VDDLREMILLRVNEVSRVIEVNISSNAAEKFADGFGI
jgi:hypothetical protein